MTPYSLAYQLALEIVTHMFCRYRTISSSELGGDGWLIKSSMQENFFLCKMEHINLLKLYGLIFINFTETSFFLTWAIAYNMQLLHMLSTPSVITVCIDEYYLSKWTFGIWWLCILWISAAGTCSTQN